MLVTTALAGTAATAQTLPSGGTVVAGKATVRAPAGGSLGITQTSPRAIINWNDFSVGAGGQVAIRQPSSSSALLKHEVAYVLGQMQDAHAVDMLKQASLLGTRVEELWMVVH